MDQSDAGIWIFGYGSLMWQPGFAFEERQPALLRGYHRRFCVYSVHYRGTPERKGLVLGLDRGGACRGVAFRVRNSAESEVLRYLDAREQVTMVYLRRQVRVLLPDGRQVPAWTYVADRGHEQYAAGLDPPGMAAIIRESIGKNGPNRAYLESTVRHLEDSGVVDRALRRLLHLVDGR
ncbi:MAG: gamma-glutamylcyclotransferase [Acetobacterales bacterium]